MTVSADDIRAVMLRTTTLERKVAALRNRVLPRAAEMSPATSCTFVCPDLTPQHPIWVNGGPDCWVNSVGYQVWWIASGHTQVKLHDLGNGLGVATDPEVEGSSQQIFDFQWNMTKQCNRDGTQKSFVSAPGSFNSLLSRQSLGNMETNRPLKFEPWKIERGDSIFFTIRPTAYFWNPNGPYLSATSRFVVAIYLSSFVTQVEYRGG